MIPSTYIAVLLIIQCYTSGILLVERHSSLSSLTVTQNVVRHLSACARTQGMMSLWPSCVSGLCSQQSQLVSNNIFTVAHTCDSLNEIRTHPFALRHGQQWNKADHGIHTKISTMHDKYYKFGQNSKLLLLFCYR